MQDGLLFYSTYPTDCYRRYAHPLLLMPVKLMLLLNKRSFWLVIVLCATLLLYWYNPIGTLFMPRCPFKVLTGLDCPGCGFLRATHAFLHGRPAEAWAYNRFLVYSIPYLLIVMFTEWGLKGERQERWRRVVEGATAIRLYLLLFEAWGVVRNIYHL